MINITKDNGEILLRALKGFIDDENNSPVEVYKAVELVHEIADLVKESEV